MVQKFIAAFAALAFTFSANVVAGEDSKPLTEDQAKRFVASLTTVDTLRKEMEANGKIDNMRIDMQPKPGEAFKPYSNAVSVMKEKYPAEHSKLSNSVKPHGFSTAQWGDVGDRVMVAYLALRMEKDDPRTAAMMKGMDKSMLDMMPPEMRAQVEQSFVMMETVKNAPDADKKVVSTVKADLDAYMETQEKQAHTQQ